MPAELREEIRDDAILTAKILVVSTALSAAILVIGVATAAVSHVDTATAMQYGAPY